MRSGSILGLLVLAMTACGGRPAAEAPSPSTSTVLTAAPIDSSMMLRTGTGLQFRDLTIGTGPIVTDGQFVSVYYIGQLLNGREFDATLPPREPIRFQVGARRVIRGWDEGLVGMRVGGRRQLIIPPSLGYGSRPTGSIPPGSTLVFTIEIVAAN